MQELLWTKWLCGGPPQQFGVPVPVTLRALHTHVLPWADTKGPFFSPVPKDVRNSLLELRGLVTNINFRNR